MYLNIMEATMRRREREERLTSKECKDECRGSGRSLVDDEKEKNKME